MSVSDTVSPATGIIQTHKPSLVSEGLLKCNGAGWVGGGGEGRGDRRLKILQASWLINGKPLPLSTMESKRRSEA